jgi:hypothetical protein
MTFVYALRDPFTGETRYIGVTNDLEGRLRAHISRARSHQTNHHCANWIRQLLSRGMTPEIAVVSTIEPGQDWQLVEADAITSARSAGHPLTNMTGGGEGFRDLSPESLKKRGDARRAHLSDPINYEKHIKATTESRLNLEVRTKQSVGVKSAWSDPEKKARMLSGIRRQDVVARHRETTRARMADPVKRAAISKKMREVCSTPEARERLRLAREKRWSKKS